MDIRTDTPDIRITVVEIDAGTDHAWHFMPFEDRLGRVCAIDDRYVLAVGDRPFRDTAVAVFDTHERRRTAYYLSKSLSCYVGLRGGSPAMWCYAPHLCSLFFLERSTVPTASQPYPALDCLQQISLDGLINRRVPVAPGVRFGGLATRDDGCIVCIGLSQVAVVEPVSGAVRVSSTDRIKDLHFSYSHARLKWISPDGRWALRAHLGEVIRSGRPVPADRRSGALQWLRPFRRASVPEATSHPDLEGSRGFAMALDLWRLDPIGVERRLVVGWYREDALSPALVAMLDALADKQLDDEWDGQRETLFVEKGEESEQVKRWFERIEAIAWDEDSRGFTVSLLDCEREVRKPDGWRNTVQDFKVRHVSLDGTLGPVSLIPGKPKDYSQGLPSRAAYEAIRLEVRQRSSHRMTCAGWTGSDVAQTLAAMRGLLEDRGLDSLVFAAQLQFRFDIDRRTIGEKRFFEKVRALPETETVLILHELRALLRTYGKAARDLEAQNVWPIMSGPSDHSPAALSEAALTLALLDPTGFDALKDWIIAVDQEHDYFAAAKVFPAVARRTGFASPEAVRFGLWFFLQQWQTVSYEKAYLGLFKAAASIMPPAQFAAAALELAQDVASFSAECSVLGGLDRVSERLGRSFWDRSVQAELDRLIAQLDTDSD